VGPDAGSGGGIGGNPTQRTQRWTIGGPDSSLEASSLACLVLFARATAGSAALVGRFENHLSRRSIASHYSPNPLTSFRVVSVRLGSHLPAGYLLGIGARSLRRLSRAAR
jgi:hypothetical protein